MMKVQLSKVFIQTDRFGKDESALTLMVKFDSTEMEVERVRSVFAYEFKSGKTVDITAIMSEQFEEQLNSMVDSIDWNEIYRENKYCFEVHDESLVIHDTVGVIKSLQSHFE